MLNLDVVVIAIILVNVLVSLKGLNDFSFLERYKFNIGGIRRGEQIRMLTSGFLHVDHMHLFFNMFTLYFFAPVVLNALGNIKFLVIYFCSLIVGNLFSLFFHKDEYHYSAVGASGAVSGIIFSAILFQPGMKLYLMFIPIPIPAYIFGIGYLLYSIYGMKSRSGNIGHDAHFGGAVGGYVVTLILAPFLFQENLLMIGLLAIPIIVLFVMQRLGKL
ncbi:rhomboid family intramembrane serine protease [Aquimarina sp. MMG015]|uniref:rhomboid family intramembrane serine protease n=1 Tax=Aquimarina TaxID=290174 RepID=UPI00041A9333|nr:MULTISPECIES: rhomboid family intramembrane serine protease [Aquimarina]AXT55750.1 rhomboid family intramembrane serine protease [Aquimarina sp. AD1]MBQ4805437.1 rhomboid family intramembrane serine protease [Aquimarina sp. MMG015]RKN15613.1 rhomboid family intramembrane serine protease [Aquimarina sp. AD1]